MKQPQNHRIHQRLTVIITVAILRECIHSVPARLLNYPQSFSPFFLLLLYLSLFFPLLNSFWPSYFMSSLHYSLLCFLFVPSSFCFVFALLLLSYCLCFSLYYYVSFFHSINLYLFLHLSFFYFLFLFFYLFHYLCDQFLFRSVFIFFFVYVYNTSIFSLHFFLSQFRSIFPRVFISLCLCSIPSYYLSFFPPLLHSFFH